MSEKYMIISVTLMYHDTKRDFWMDMHSWVYHERCKVIRDYYKRHHEAEVYFNDNKNNIGMTRNFAEVEYNFDLTDKEKETLSDMRKLFFAEGEFNREDIEKVHFLDGVIFKKIRKCASERGRSI